MHCVYKYVLDQEVIYIGKTDADLDRRLSQHGKCGDNISKEGWDDINRAEIFYIDVPNATMSDVIESELIRRYRPKYNKAKMSEWRGLPFVEPEWKKYIPEQAISKVTGYENERLISLIENKKTLLKLNDDAYRIFRYIQNELRTGEPEKMRSEYEKRSKCKNGQKKLFVKYDVPVILCAKSSADTCCLSMGLYDDGYAVKQDFLNDKRDDIKDFLNTIAAAKKEYKELIRKYVSHKPAKTLKNIGMPKYMYGPYTTEKKRALMGEFVKYYNWFFFTELMKDDKLRKTDKFGNIYIQYKDVLNAEWLPFYQKEWLIPGNTRGWHDPITHKRVTLYEHYCCGFGWVQYKDSYEIAKGYYSKIQAESKRKLAEIIKVLRIGYPYAFRGENDFLDKYKAFTEYSNTQNAA